jgi:3-mercaptopyruvate sulfurtransferase SseA
LRCAVPASDRFFAAKNLARLGYESVYSMAGGFARWKVDGLPVEVPFALGGPAREQNSRHLLMPEVGEASSDCWASART